MALTDQDIEQIKRKYIEGQPTNFIGEQFGVTGGYIRQLSSKYNWREERDAFEKTNALVPTNKNELTPARESVMERAKSLENFRKRTPVTEEYILDLLRQGVSPSAAARSAGVTPETLKRWRNTEGGEFNIRCFEAQADFIAGLETIACDVKDSKSALEILKHHRLSKEEWGKTEDKQAIRIEFSYDRHASQNAIDGEFQEVKEIEAPKNE